jgi:flagellar hook-length control protein FliK
MAIQQVASGSSSGIMSFLFQDDGSTEGTVLEGAEFAKTLHHLLGEYEGGGEESTEAKTPMSEEVATVITDTESELKDLTAPLTSSLEGLIKDFKLPEHGAKLPQEAGFEGEAEGQEVEQPFWGIAPFTDVMTSLHEHTSNAPSTSTEIEVKPAEVEAKVTEPEIKLAANDPALPEAQAETPAAPVFTSGLAHVIALARDAAQASTALNRQPAPNAAPQASAGRSAPLSGKLLPQGIRPVTTALNQPAANSPNAKAVAQAALLTDTTQPVPEMEASVSTAFFADLLNVNAEAPGQQAASPQTQAISHALHGLRAESPVANLPRAASADAAPANPLPQVHSQHLAGTDAWFQDLGARVDWLKDMKVEKAEMQLHPAELGLLDIQISTGDDGTTVSFITHNSEARQMIEDNMPRLRDLLASQGMQLGQSHVSQHSEGQRRGHETNSGQGHAQRNDTAAEEQAPVRRRAYVADPSRIDHYV